MRLKNFIFAFVILFIGFVSSVGFCIDHTNPSAISNLTSSGSIGNLNLSWAASVDMPECSGILYYEVYRNDVLLGETENLNYLTSANYGANVFSIVAVDLALHKSSRVNLTLTFFDDSSGGGGGGSSTSSVEKNDTQIENCLEWSECIDGVQTQTCEYGPNSIVQTRTCALEEIEEQNNDGQDNQTTNETTENNGGFFRATGGAITNLGESIVTPQVGIPLLAILGLGGFFFVVAKRKNKKK